MQDIHVLCRSDIILYLGANKQSPDFQSDPLSFIRCGPIMPYARNFSNFDEFLYQEFCESFTWIKRFRRQKYELYKLL